MPSPPISPSPATFSSPSPQPSPSTYRYTPTELQVFSSTPSLAPYKAALLPLWRFRTPAVAHTSAAAIWARFLAYEQADDFVGMDMARKYLQMGMTRAKRYANYRGGRKWVRGVREEEGEAGGEGGDGVGDVKEEEGGDTKGRKAVGKSEDHAGKAEKEEASRIFREVWERAKRHEGYVARKEAWLAEQRRGDRERKRAGRGDAVVEDGRVQKRRKRDTVKVEGE